MLSVISAENTATDRWCTKVSNFVGFSRELWRNGWIRQTDLGNWVYIHIRNFLCNHDVSL